MNKQFSYSLFDLWFGSIIKLGGFIFLVANLYLFDRNSLGIILSITIFVVFIKNILNTIRNLYRSIAEKPAFEITDEYFVIHTNNTKIHLKNINEIQLVGSGKTQAIRFYLKNRNNYINQIKDPFHKLFFILAPDVANIQIGVNYIKGDNQKVYEEIKDFFIKKSN